MDLARLLVDRPPEEADMTEPTDLQKVAQYIKSDRAAPAEVYNAACRLLEDWAEIHGEGRGEDEAQDAVDVGAQVQDDRYRAGTVVRLWDVGTGAASADVDMGSYFGTCVNVPIDRLKRI